MADDVVPLRNALVKRLEDDPDVFAACPTVWGEKQPADSPWPFIRYGVPILTPDEVSTLTGARHRVTLHVFARGPSMDECSAICALVVDNLDGVDVDLVFPDGVTREATAYELFCNGQQIIPDGDDDWHGILEFDVAVAGA